MKIMTSEELSDAIMTKHFKLILREVEEEMESEDPINIPKDLDKKLHAITKKYKDLYEESNQKIST